MQYNYDVVVIGGGPSGSCTAGNLARQGIRVLVIEGKSFPRDHIGESLLAMSMPLLRDFGVESKLHTADFIRKPGALFIWGKSGKELELGMPHPGYAFQVLRSRFDQLLLEHSQEQGAHVAQKQWVRGLVRDATGRICGVHVEEKGGQTRELRCRFLVDASGLAQFLPRRLNLPIQLEGSRRIALSNYFKGALRPASPHQDDIISEACQDGWIWFIPLSTELTSVGFVGDEYMLNGRPGVILAQQIATSKLVRKLLEPAMVTREVQVLRYTNHMVDAPLWGDGYVLVGDSAIFVDPLFSTGVHGALYSASLAAACLTSFLAGKIPEAEVADWYDRRVRNHYFRVNETVKLLYGIHPGASSFWRSRDLSKITDDEAEQMAQRLGAVGMAFFAHAMHAGVLDLPPSLKMRVPEFISQIKPISTHQDQIVRLAPEVKLSINWMRHQGQLVSAVSLTHARNRTPPAEFPAGSFHARLLQALDGRHTLAAALEAVQEDRGDAPGSHKEKKAAVFVGTLIQAGLLRTIAAPIAADSTSSKLAVITEE